VLSDWVSTPPAVGQRGRHTREPARSVRRLHFAPDGLTAAGTQAPGKRAGCREPARLHYIAP